MGINDCLVYYDSTAGEVGGPSAVAGAATAGSNLGD